MLAEFLPYRYKGLFHPSELLARNTDIGWKCRRYSKWKQVHNSDDDRRLLLSFADSLIEYSRVEFAIYGQITEVFLNVQRWRLDRESLSLNPPVTEAWEYVDTMLKVVNKFPASIATWLMQHNVRIGETSSEIEERFYIVLLDEFFRRDRTSSFRELSSQSTESLEALRETFISGIAELYETVGKTAPAADDFQEFLLQTYSDLGFEIEFGRELPLEETLGAINQEVFIEYSAFEKTKLVKFHLSQGHVFVHLNTNHPFVRALKDSAAEREWELFFKNAGRAFANMALHTDVINDYFSYIGLHLMQPISPPTEFF